MGDWNQKTITAPINITTAADLRAWMLTDGVIPQCDHGIVITNKDTNELENNELTLVVILNGKTVLWDNNVNGWYARARGSTHYYQQRGFQNEEEVIVYAGTEYTIFYR